MGIRMVQLARLASVVVLAGLVLLIGMPAQASPSVLLVVSQSVAVVQPDNNDEESDDEDNRDNERNEDEENSNEDTNGDGNEDTSRDDEQDDDNDDDEDSSGLLIGGGIAAIGAGITGWLKRQAIKRILRRIFRSKRRNSDEQQPPRYTS